MNKIEIDKGVAMPEPRGTLSRALRAMKVGESFLYPRSKRTAIPIYGKRAGVKVTTRIVSETLIRVWRIE